MLGEVARGQDPAEKRNADRKAISFAELCDLYLNEGVAHKKASTLRVDRGRIELHLKPLLGAKRADAVTRADVEKLLNDVKRGRSAAREPQRRGLAASRRAGRGRRSVRRLGLPVFSSRSIAASAPTIRRAASKNPPSERCSGFSARRNSRASPMR